MWHTLLGPATRASAQRTALSDATRTLTHAELRARADAFAAHLQRAGVAPGDRVALLTGKDVETVVALYAVLRCGAAYVPLDRAAPLQRRRALADEAAARACIAPAAHADEMQAEGRLFIASESVLQAADALAEKFPALSPGMLACVVHTSGSTGRPKGVKLTHGNLAALFAAHRACMRMDETSVCLNTTPFYFDGSIGDCLFPLSLGAAVQIGPSLPVPATLLRLMQERRVTHLCIVPSSLARMTDEGAGERRHDLSALQTIIFGGEAAELPMLQAWRTAWPQLRLVNGYGPTEATYVCVAKVWEQDTPVVESPLPIGTPHAGLHAVLLRPDGGVACKVAPRHGSAPPPGHREGELALAGPQVSPGYWHRPDEDARAFVSISGTRYYRTGDLCQLNASHELVYCGRVDEEAKINGQRIHMAEVRAALCQEPAISECVAFPLKRPPGVATLGCALVCPPAWSRDDVLALARTARQRVPASLVPKHFLVMHQALPRLPSGKVDIGAVSRELHARLAAGEDHVFFAERACEPTALQGHTPWINTSNA